MDTPLASSFVQAADPQDPRKKPDPDGTDPEYVDDPDGQDAIWADA